MFAIVIKLKKLLFKLDSIKENNTPNIIQFEKRKKARMSTSEKLEILQSKMVRLNIGVNIFHKKNIHYLNFPRAYLSKKCVSHQMKYSSTGLTNS